MDDELIGKRRAAEVAEANFYSLLKEQKSLIAEEAKDGAAPLWKDVGLWVPFQSHIYPGLTLVAL